MAILFDITRFDSLSQKYVFGFNSGVQRFIQEIATRLEMTKDFQPYYLSLNTYRCLSLDQKLDVIKNPSWRSSYNEFLVKFSSYDRRMKLGALRGDIWGNTNLSLVEPLKICFIPYPLPYSFPIIKSYPELMYFVVVHDLISFVYPRYFDENLCIRQLASLRSISSCSYVHFIAVSESTKQDLIKYVGVKPQNITTMPLGANTRVFYRSYKEELLNKIRKQYGIRHSRYFLYVSRYLPRKRPCFILQSFALWCRQNPHEDIGLVLIGGDFGSEPIDYLEELYQITVDHSIQDKVYFLGFVLEDDMAIFYQHALVLLYPSIYEGFGLTPLECMSCGTSVIASAHSSLKEVIGKGGVFCDLEEKQDWVNAMNSFVYDQNYRKTMEEQAFLQSQKFSWDHSISLLTECFDTHTKVML